MRVGSHPALCILLSQPQAPGCLWHQTCPPDDVWIPLRGLSSGDAWASKPLAVEASAWKVVEGCEPTTLPSSQSRHASCDHKLTDAA